MYSAAPVLLYVQEVVTHFIYYYFYLLYKMGHYFLDTQYIISGPEIECSFHWIKVEKENEIKFLNVQVVLSTFIYYFVI